jgi:GxxExxY protein
MKHEELTHKIIGCAYKVYNQLGFGFLESIYRKAMVIELNRADLNVEEEKSLTVYYDEGEDLGVFSADLFVEDSVVVELKTQKHIVKENEAQLVNYLKGLRKDIGLLINFGPDGVEVKRKFREYKPKEE